MAFRAGLLASLATILLSPNYVAALPTAVAPSGSLTTQLPSSTVTMESTSGRILTTLDLFGHVTSLPFVTATTTMPIPDLQTPLPIPTPSISINASIFGLLALPSDTACGIDPFQAVATGAVPASIKSRSDHPVPRLNIAQQDNPLQTNKFYANFFLGDQGFGTFTHPYTVTWSKGGSPVSSWGMVVNQLDYSMKAFGKPNEAIPGSPASNIINPIGIQDLVLSAAELGSSTSLSTSNLEAFSANVILSPTNTSSASTITFPLVQGMGFVTAVYKNLTPLIQSGVSIRSMTAGISTSIGIWKYTITTNDGNSWLLYVIPTNLLDPLLKLSSTAVIQGLTGFSGVIQVAKNPNGTEGEAIYDASAGVWATGVDLSGRVDNTTGAYTFTWTKAGDLTKKLLMWALPHHVKSFSPDTAAGLQKMKLTTTTKGNATAVVGDLWTMTETNLPSSMGFAPWDPATGASTANYSAEVLKSITAAAVSELSEDMDAQSNLNSMYYSGKALAKFASIVYVAKDVLKDDNLTVTGLTKLEKAFSLFSTNQQQFPLVYDEAWGGVVSSASYVNGDLGSDFGNTAYNDHHFHWGYFIYAASVIGYLDPTWLATHKDWVNALVRDAANPSSDDNDFPVFRNFDWYHGHSWAHGLFAAGDGKDEESSSEDTNFAYAIKMWGKVIGDKSMEARGNLMLSVLTRSLNSYMLYSDDNDVMPPQYIGNKVSGIFFENKIDHTTYFGSNLEYIQGIHMLPILPHSALVRKSTFVEEEWKKYFAEDAVVPASKVAGGWRGILFSNLALYDAKTSYDFFAQPNFNSSFLDGGASLTWYLTYAAGRGGV